MSVVPEQVEDFLERLRKQIREDVELANDLAAIRAGTFEPAPEPETGLF